MRAICAAILFLALTGPVLAEDAEADAILAELASPIPSKAAWGAYRAGQQGIRAAIPALVSRLLPRPGRGNQEELALRLAMLDALILLKATVPGDLDPDLLLRQSDEVFRERVLILLAGRPRDNRAQLLELFKPRSTIAFDLENMAVGNLLCGVRAEGFAARLLSLLKFELDVTVFSTGEPRGLSAHQGLPRSARKWPGPPEGFPPLTRYEFVAKDAAGGILLASGPRPIFVIRHEVKSKGGWEEVFKEPTWRGACTFEWLSQLLGVDPEQVRFREGADLAVVLEGREDFLEQVREARCELIRPWYELLDRCLKAKLLSPREARGIDPEVLVQIYDYRTDQSIPLPTVGTTDWVYAKEFEVGSPFGGRGGPRKLRAEGGSEATEAAVDAGLAWLDRHQHWTGRWDADGFSRRYAREACAGPGKADLDIVVTSFALLAYLGASETDRYGNHQRVVREGLTWLLDQQDDEGRFRSGSKRLRLYEHALATLAVREAYSSTWDPVLAESARRGKKVLRAARRPDGSWGDEAGREDPALTIWALRAAGAEASASMRPRFKSWETTDFALDGPLFPHSRPSLLCLIVFLRDLHKHDWNYRVSQDPIVPFAAEGLREPRTLGEWSCGTLGMFRVGEEYWKAWNQKMKKTLLPLQVKEGCERGSWNPEDFGGSDLGRVGVTACLVACLEAYYRYRRCF